MLAVATLGLCRLLIIQIVRRSANLLFEVAPHRLGPPIGAGDPGRGARIDTAVERLVALAQLLPLKTAEAALGLDGDELLADELLQPLGLGAVRQVHVARRAFCTRGDFLVGRRRPGAGSDRSRS